MRYDTNGKGLEPGEYVVKVVSYPQEKNLNGGWMKIEMEFSIAGQDRPIKQGFFPNQLKDMFIALGFKEVEPGIFDGDIQEAYEKSFLAELYLEDYTKKDGTAGKARKLRNFRAIPVNAPVSGNPGGISKPSDIAWEE